MYTNGILSYLRYLCVVLLLFLHVGLFYCLTEMAGGAGRNDDAIAAALIAAAQAVAQAQGNGG